jgi:3',5'-cyclic AMP phosphodiesterase CpdA
MTTITWLHIADLHFRLGQTYDASIVLRELLKDVAARSEQADLRPDFIVVTGDVAFSGQPAEYDLACHFFDDLLRTTGLDKEYLFVVPGNHDVNRSLISRGAQLLAGSLRDRDSVNAVLDTPGDRQLLLARLQNYGSFVNDYLDGHTRFDGENYFHVRTLALAGLQIAILGLNSAWLAHGGDEDRGKLVLGERQVREALDQASTADLKIALLHHPFDWLQDFDRQDCEALLSAHCDFVLHGHVHSASTARITSPDSATQIFACGAGFEMREKMNRYNYVRLDLEAGQGTVFWRIWSDRGGGFWTQDAMTYRNAPDGTYTFPLPAPLRAPSPKPTPSPTQRPRVVRTMPPNGAENVDPRLTTIHIQFSEEMRPGATSLTVLNGPFGLSEETLCVYNTDTHTFGFVLNRPGSLADYLGCEASFRVNDPRWHQGEEGAGFAGITGISAETSEFRFQTARSPGTVDPAHTPVPDLKALRDLFDTQFNDASLDALCQTHFPTVYEALAWGLTKDEKVKLLLDYFCGSPERYARLQAALSEQPKPAEPTPKPPRLHIDPGDPPIAAIRGLLEAAFPGATLKQFCQDRSQFRGAMTRFGMAAGPADLADKMIEYCGQFLLWDDLLAEVALVNPGQYARFEASLSGSNPPLAQRSNPTSSFDRESSERALRLDRRTLAILEEQAAAYTALTIPAHLQIELEEQRRKVTELEARLA